MVAMHAIPRRGPEVSGFIKAKAVEQAMAACGKNRTS